jgi:hypothetical protein
MALESDEEDKAADIADKKKRNTYINRQSKAL